MSKLNAVAKCHPQPSAVVYPAQASHDGGFGSGNSSGRDTRWRPFMTKKSKELKHKGWSNCLKSRASIASTDNNRHFEWQTTSLADITDIDRWLSNTSKALDHLPPDR